MVKHTNLFLLFLIINYLLLFLIINNLLLLMVIVEPFEYIADINTFYPQIPHVVFLKNKTTVFHNHSTFINSGYLTFLQYYYLTYSPYSILPAISYALYNTHLSSQDTIQDFRIMHYI